jgi:hypothetical protein
MNFDPFAQWGKAFETWQKLTGDSVARMTAIYAEMDRTDARRVQQMESAIDEVARLQKETLAYGAQLGVEFRKLSLEAMQSMSSLASTPNKA